MKVFISWSGGHSRLVATALHDWLPKVIQSVEPFMSSEDIAAGNRWQQDVAAELEASIFGLVCVTRENQRSPWLNFEAGALAKTVESARVVPIAIDLTPADIEQPLGQFQAQPITREGLHRIASSINEASESPLDVGILDSSLEKWWPELELKLGAIEPTRAPQGVPARDDRELLEEVLDTVRSLARDAPSASVSARDLDAPAIEGFLTEVHAVAPSVAAWTADTSGTVLTLYPSDPLSTATRAAIFRAGRRRGLTVKLGEGGQPPLG